MNRRPVALAAALLAAIIPLAPRPAAAQFTVFDPSNYAQNVLTAARTLQQVNNQLTALQNQARMLENQALQLKSLDYTALAPMREAFAKVQQLTATAQGLALDLKSTQALLDQTFPAALNASASTKALVAQANAQAQAATAAYRQTLQVQAQVVENLQGDAPLIAELVDRSQGASGGLQAQQAASQLQALAIKQDQQLQAMTAAEYRAEALERVRQAQALAAGKLAAQRFVGEAKAYTPD